MTRSLNAKNLRKTALPLLAVAAAGLMAACTTVGEPVENTSGAGTSTTSAEASTGSPTATVPAGGLPSGVTPEMAQSLCDDLAGQAQSMRTYTVTVGKVTLNTVVGTWAVRYNLNLVDLAQNRGKVDQILETQCPDVRAEVIQALELPDIASGLVGT